MTIPNLCDEALENAIMVHETCEKSGMEMQPLDAVAVQAMKELLKYRKIGTVEECRAASGKLVARIKDGITECCGYDFGTDQFDTDICFCPKCGRKLDRSEDE